MKDLSITLALITVNILATSLIYVGGEPIHDLNGLCKHLLQIQ